MKDQMIRIPERHAAVIRRGLDITQKMHEYWNFLAGGGDPESPQASDLVMALWFDLDVKAKELSS